MRVSGNRAISSANKPHPNLVKLAIVLRRVCLFGTFGQPKLELSRPKHEIYKYMISNMDLYTQQNGFFEKHCAKAITSSSSLRILLPHSLNLHRKILDHSKLI